MSFKAVFKVDGEEFNVLNSSYSLHQETDATGRPSTITRGGKVTITVESTGSQKLSDWMFNNFETKDVSIVYFKRDTEASLKELRMEMTYAVKYTETFDANGKTPMIETITVSAKTISMGNGEHRNDWAL
ncbi:type VI secretion system tube protein TssD [Aquimarina sp. I32.4]|uniref:type VI secretion system tube protein TssD n=1 Tax=Aquimarina sp. I32.4 TaxID=2053903 RepID=UPI000CDEDA8A|nr:type VI secretion system tube protein TssD [Aquimarina sp. I32.4]